MKKLFVFVVISAITICAIAQPPKRISYQQVIRDTENRLVSNHSVGMRISILQSSASGTPVYVETHKKTTNSNGLITLEIGGGTPVSGNFATISWSSDIYFIKTETDPGGGTSYSISGTSQILSVPYALYAASAPPTTNANAISSGTLDPLYYSAYQDLTEEGRLDNTTGSDILTRTQADSRYNQKIGFYAFNTDYDYNSTNNAIKVEFNQESLDDGNCYDDTRDRFIAPVAGVYNFSVTVYVDTPSAVNAMIYYLFLYLNGEERCLLNQIRINGPVTLTGSVTMKLGASSYVEIFLAGDNAKIFGTNTRGFHQTWFSGHLVYPVL